VPSARAEGGGRLIRLRLVRREIHVERIGLATVDEDGFIHIRSSQTNTSPSSPNFASPHSGDRAFRAQISCGEPSGRRGELKTPYKEDTVRNGRFSAHFSGRFVHRTTGVYPHIVPEGTPRLGPLYRSMRATGKCEFHQLNWIEPQVVCGAGPPV
jgi:hypothetical protein